MFCIFTYLIVGVEDFVYFLDVESDVAMSVRPVVTGKTLEWFLARVDPQVLSQLRVYQELFTTMGANEIASLLMNALEIEFSSYYQTQTSNHRYFGDTYILFTLARISTIIVVTIFLGKWSYTYTLLFMWVAFILFQFLASMFV